MPNPSANVGIYQISEIETELQSMLHGTTLNQIGALPNLETRAARRLLEDVDPQETKVVAQFGQIWQNVYSYIIPIDVKGNKIIYILPQANATPYDNYEQQYNKAFQMGKYYSLSSSFTPKYNNGVRTIDINGANLPNGILINQADGYNTNGTWVTSNNASNVGTNNLYYTNGASGSLSFQLNQTGVPGSIGTITNSTFSPINLTSTNSQSQSNYNNGVFFFYVYLPNAAGINSLTFNVGTDASDYWTQTGITQTQAGYNFVNGWNLISVPWTGMTTVGSPNPANIAWIQFSFNYNGTIQTQVLLNQIYNRLGIIMNIEYYSKYLFRDAVTGVFQETVTSTSNYVNLDTDGINMYLWAILAEACRQQQGLNAIFADGPSAEQNYQTSLQVYKNKYLSEITKPRANYYPNRQLSYRRFFGRGWNTR